MKTISVVVTMHNQAQYIEKALSTILEQYVKVNEIIVVDCASSDEGLERVAQRRINNVRIVQHNTSDISEGRKVGAAKAKSDLVAFMDAQDTWLPFFTFEIQSLAKRFPKCEVFATRYQLVAEDDLPVDANIFLNSVTPNGYVLSDYLDIAQSGDLPFVPSSTVIAKRYLDIMDQSAQNFTSLSYLDFCAHAAVDNVIAYSPNIHLHYRKRTTDDLSCRLSPYQLKGFIERLQAAPLNNQQFKSVSQYCAERGLNIVSEYLHKGEINQALALLSLPFCRYSARRYFTLFIAVKLIRLKAIYTKHFLFLKRGGNHESQRNHAG